MDDQEKAWRSVLDQRPGLWLLTAAAAQGRALQLMRQGRIRRKDVNGVTEQLKRAAIPQIRAAFLNGDVVGGLRCIGALYPEWMNEGGRMNGVGLCRALEFDVISLDEALDLSAGSADHDTVLALANARTEVSRRRGGLFQGLRRRRSVP